VSISSSQRPYTFNPDIVRTLFSVLSPENDRLLLNELEIESWIPLVIHA